jgi:hypothetical protein
MDKPAASNGFEKKHGATPSRKRERQVSSQESQRKRPEKRSREAKIFGLGVSMDENDHRIIDTFAGFTQSIEIDTAILAENARKVAAADKARSEITEQAVAACGISPDSTLLGQPDENPQLLKKCKILHVRQTCLDFFASLASSPELLVELAIWLSPKSLLKLYCISKDFYSTINNNFSSTMKHCANHHAAESAKLFAFKFYGDLFVRDPNGTPHPNRPWEVRLVPSVNWLQMVVHRDRCVRDILACLAQQGHRTPQGMTISIKKMWLVMDVATSAGRTQLCHAEEFIRDTDLFNWQLFIVKLDMRFNDPIDGPGDDGMRKLLLGQKGLTTLWKLLKRKAYFSTLDVVKLMVRYRYSPRPQHVHLPLFGIPPEKIGIEHLEGWGKGRVHLMRPDELVIKESVRRSLGLKHHIMEMMLWGYVDPITGRDTPATEEEKYISDDEEKSVDPYWCEYEARDSDVEYIEDTEAVDTVNTGANPDYYDSVHGDKDTPMNNA